MSETRCGLCGKVVHPAEEVALIDLAVAKKNGEFSVRKRWGVCHESCLNKALPTPKAAMAEISRLSKQAVKAAPKDTLKVRTPPDLFPGTRSKKAAAKKKASKKVPA